MTPQTAEHYEHDQPNAYQWTEEAYGRLVAGSLTANVIRQGNVQSVLVKGPCPHCEHDVAFTEILDAVAGEPLGVLGSRIPNSETSYVEVTVSCRCTAADPRRPTGIDRGCGINFLIEVLSDS